MRTSQNILEILGRLARWPGWAYLVWMPITPDRSRWYPGTRTVPGSRTNRETMEGRPW